MNVLALDFGTSSLKAAVLRGTRVVGRIVRVPMRGGAEIEAESFLRGLRVAVAQLSASAVKRVDYVALSVMSPSWVAMDRRGRAITPVVTHQDRRSLKEAMEIERRIGRERHLRLAGNRPIPGGISSTTHAWYLRNRRAVMKKAELVGHLNTFLHRQLTGTRVVDPGNATFMGLCAISLGFPVARTQRVRGTVVNKAIGIPNPAHAVACGLWCDELIDAVGADRKVLPEIREGNEVAGGVTREAAKAFGLTQGLPMLTGVIDTSAAMMLAGAEPGRMLNVCGSTDVLAVCVDRPKPDERYLTRGLGVDGKWLCVSTIAAAGSALEWARRTLYPELSAKKFYARVEELPETAVTCVPAFAGSRLAIEQPTGSFENVTLGTTRDDLLRAIVDALREENARRLPVLKAVAGKVMREVVVTGGASSALQGSWAGKWRFRFEEDASVRGVGAMEVIE